MKIRLVLVLLAIAYLIAACGSNSEGPTPQPPGLSLVAGRIDVLNGTGTAARFTSPQGVAVDLAGNVYVTEPFLHIVRRIAPNGAVTTLAGAVGIGGYRDGPAATALFNGPTAIAADADGNVYVTDTGNLVIRKVSAAGVVSTVAGTPGVSGLADGPGTSALFADLQGMTADRAGNLFVGDSDFANVMAVVRRIDRNGVVSTLTLGPLGGYLSLATASNGGLYLGDSGHRGATMRGSPSVRLLAPDRTLTVLATFGDISSEAGMQSLNGLAADTSGNVYASNGQFVVQPVPNPASRQTFTGNTIVWISASGTKSTLAGAWGQSGSSDGVGSAATFNQPQGLAMDAQGNLIVADAGNNTVRKVATAGNVTTIAGHAPLSAPIDGTGTQAGFVNITGLATDKKGNAAIVEPHAVRRLNASGVVTTIWNEPGPSDLMGAALDSAGNVYAAGAARSTYYAAIIKVSASGIRSTFGPGGYYFIDLGASEAGDIYAMGIGSFGSSGGFFRVAPDGTVLSSIATDSLGPFAIDRSGNLYVCVEHSVVQIAGDGSATTLAGVSGTPGYADGLAASALFRSPQGIAVDNDNNVYIADTGNNVIRKISAAGRVSTVAGTFGLADTVMGTLPGGLYQPGRLAFDADGSLLVAVNGAAIVRVRLP